MTVSMFQISVPVYIQKLEVLSALLDKAAAHAALRKFDPALLLAYRISPDMFPLSRQVSTAITFAIGTVTRIAGIEGPVFRDADVTLDDVKDRIATAVAYLRGVSPAQLDGTDDKEIVVQRAGKPVPYIAQDYFLNVALPQFYFHLTAAYAILRHAGVDVGKRDFLG